MLYEGPAFKILLEYRRHVTSHFIWCLIHWNSSSILLQLVRMLLVWTVNRCSSVVSFGKSQLWDHTPSKGQKLRIGVYFIIIHFIYFCLLNGWLHKIWMEHTGRKSVANAEWPFKSELFLIPSKERLQWLQKNKSILLYLSLDLTAQ